MSVAEPLKDQAILDFEQCYLNINSFMKETVIKELIMWGNFSSYRRDDQIFDVWSEQTNTKQRIWKTVVVIKK